MDVNLRQVNYYIERLHGLVDRERFVIGPNYRQLNREAAAHSFCALRNNAAIMTTHNLAGNCQPQTDASPGSPGSCLIYLVKPLKDT